MVRPNQISAVPRINQRGDKKPASKKRRSDNNNNLAADVSVTVVQSNAASAGVPAAAVNARPKRPNKKPPLNTSVVVLDDEEDERSTEAAVASNQTSTRSGLSDKREGPSETRSYDDVLVWEPEPSQPSPYIPPVIGAASSNIPPLIGQAIPVLNTAPKVPLINTTTTVAVSNENARLKQLKKEFSGDTPPETVLVLGNDESRPLAESPRLFRATDGSTLLLCVQQVNVAGLCCVQVLTGAVRVHNATLRASPDWHVLCAPDRFGHTLSLTPVAACLQPTDLTQGDTLRQILRPSEHALLLSYVRGAVLLRFRADDRPYVITLRDVYGMRLFRPTQAASMGHLLCNTAALMPRPNAFHAHIDNMPAVRKVIRGMMRPGRQCVLVCGDVNSGKTSVSTAILNALVTETDRPVYYVDTDVGQSLFTPSGCVSCTRVRQPILGSAFVHVQTLFENAYFFGSASPHSRRDQLVAAVASLCRGIAQADACVVVNTCGWVQDLIGLELLRSLAAAVQCNWVLQMSSQPLLYAQEPADRTQYVLAPPFSSGKQRKVASMSNAELRALSVYAYLSGMLSGGHLLSAQELQPLRVPFECIGVWLFNAAELSDACVLSVLNASLVALCTADQHLLSERYSADPCMPYRCRAPGQLLRCVGYGVVRAIDPQARVLYVLTPVTDATVLARVNVLAKGDIDLPASFFTAQMQGYESPYVMETTACVDLDDEQSIMYTSNERPPVKAKTTELNAPIRFAGGRLRNQVKRNTIKLKRLQTVSVHCPKRGRAHIS